MKREKKNEKRDCKERNERNRINLNSSVWYKKKEKRT